MTVIGLLMISAALAAEPGWKDLSSDFAVYRGKTGDWQHAAAVSLDPANPKRFVIEPGTGILVNGPKGNTVNLVTKEEFGDVEVHLEFCIPKGSNAGIKLQAVYEVQIFDSFGKKVVKGEDCGGIYPRAELTPRYRHIDEGIAPLVNACKAPGEWQTLELLFRAPRFNAAGEETEDAKFEYVRLNGQLIHDQQVLKYPTGHNWSKPEKPRGPIFFQADHGPVAVRNFRVRPLP